jgi:mycothiol synthase
VIELDVVPADPALDDVLGAIADQLTEAVVRNDVDGARAALADGIRSAERVGARCRMAAEPAEPEVQQLADDTGLHLVRELLQLRRSLPLPDDVRDPNPSSFEVRAFVPGRDDAAWLDVNNRAFAWHPEQSGWTVETLRSKQAEPWFDADGFLVTELDGRLAGFCWTKVHRDHDPVLGEIFVIAVDPDIHQRGLGRFLAVAGLDWLADQGITTAMLYVEADNAPARALYDSLGFAIHHAKRWWES